MSLLSAQGKSWSSFRRGWLKGLEIENIPGYEEMELEMWPFEAEGERAVRRMADGKTAECWSGITAASGWRSGGSAGGEEQENSQHVTSPQVSFKTENS